jgi:hypothetical protein
MTSIAPFSAVGRTSSRSLTDLTEAVAPSCADGPIHFRGDSSVRTAHRDRVAQAAYRTRREEAIRMKRSRLAALLGACLVSATLALAPTAASAWWIGQPRFEKQVVTEGDPIDPGVACPNDSVVPGVEDGNSSSTTLIEAVVPLITTLLEFYP